MHVFQRQDLWMSSWLGVGSARALDLGVLCDLLDLYIDKETEVQTVT